MHFQNIYVFNLQKTLLLAQMFVHLLVEVVQALLHLLAGVLLDYLPQLLFAEGQLVAHLLLTDPLCHARLHPFKEVL